MIEIKKFTKRFGKRIIYNDISLSLPKTGVVAIVGDSGSGKTTLLNAIAGLDFDYQGEIKIDSTNLKELSENDLSDYRIHNIGYVFQNFNLLNLDSVETNIMVPFESTSNSSKKIRDRKINELTKMLDISKLKKEVVNKLSGGEKQRVAIAGILAMRPDLVIFDEATSMLDPKGKREISQTIKMMRKENPNLTLISITHDLEEAFNSDSIIVLNQGKLLFNASPKEILNHKEKLEQIGLDLPFRTKFVSLLKDKGISVSEDDSLDGIVKKICQ